MINLRMEASISSPVILGPAPWFRVDGQFIRQGPHGATVGIFRQYVWKVQAREYARYHCLEPHIIRLEDSIKGDAITLGQFRDTWVEDGILHPENTLRARFNHDVGAWYDFSTNTHWPTLVIESAHESN